MSFFSNTDRLAHLKSLLDKSDVTGFERQAWEWLKIGVFKRPEFAEVLRMAPRVEVTVGATSELPLSTPAVSFVGRFEKAALYGSDIACAVADAWVYERDGAGRDFSDPHREALDALEAATCESPLRKVKP